MAVAKSVTVDISVSGDAESKARLDAINKRADDLRAAFGPAYELKINSAAASARIGVFRADFQKVANTVTRPMDVQVLSAKATKTLAGIQAKAEELRKNFPEMTVRINDKVAKAELDLFAAEAKVKLDALDKQIAGAGSGGIGSKLLGLIPGVGGGGAGASGGAGSAASAASSGGGVLANPYVLTGAVAAGLAALPFAAQAAAAGITFALGGALAGIAILGAAKTKSVQQSFDTLKTGAVADLATIGKSFVGPLNSILATAHTMLSELTPVFAGAAKTISGPFETFGNALVNTFGNPAVVNSINAVAKAFGAILKSLAPSLAGDVNAVASGITKVANAVAANPAAFRNFISFLADTVGGALTAIAGLTKFASYLEAHFIPAFDDVRHNVAAIWNEIASNTIDVWSKIWTQTIGRAIQGGHNVEAAYNSMKNAILVALGAVKSGVATAWNAVWANTVTRVQNGIADTVRFFTQLPGKITSTLGNALTVLKSWGAGVLTGMWNGIQSVWTGVLDFFKGIPKAILKVMGFGSPPGWAIQAGKDIMSGMGIGINAHFKTVLGNATAAASAVTGALGSGVARWRPTVLQALQQLRLPSSLVYDVLAQMQSESGGNPTIVNKTDSNWLAGHPSVGLMQVIQGTFDRWAGPYRNTGPFEYGVSVNPLANIYAALNYALHGAGFGSGAGQVGSMHGYASGTGSALPGWAMVGERGPEMVRFRGGEQVVPSAGGGQDQLGAKLDRLAAKLDQLIGVTAAVPRATGQHVGAAVNGAAGQAAFRVRYP